MTRAILFGCALVLLLLSSPRPAAAQNEAEIWSELGLRHRFSRELRGSVGQHLRFDDNVSRVGAVMTEVGLSYRLIKALRVEAGYRFAYRRRKAGELGFRHRVNLDGRATYERGKLGASYRVRMQGQLRGLDGGEGFEGTVDPTTEPDASLVRYTLRNRAGVSYEATDEITPGASFELFHRFGDGETVRLRKARLTIGAEYDFGKPSVEVFYRLESPQDDPDDPTAHILGVGFQTSI